MAPVVHLTPLDPRYPARLRQLAKPPPSISVRGGSLEADRTVAIVGSRVPTGGAVRFARGLARALASAGAVIVSGGAVGIDAAAHRGAIDVGGRTWVVAGTGHRHCFPRENAELFDEIAEGPGTMIWPFGPDRPGKPGNFTTRNGYLVALSDAVVVVQAQERSGALSAAGKAMAQGKPLWVVPASPWLRRFEGSSQLLADGALPLVSLDDLLGSLGLRETMGAAAWEELPHPRTGRAPMGFARPFWARSHAEGDLRRDLSGGNRHASHLPAEAPPEPVEARPLPPLSDQESAALRATGPVPRHTDAISQDAGLTPQATAAALLTLALENVLVEGPPGFFRRQDAYNR
jgi:DNA processing protein